MKQGGRQGDARKIASADGLIRIGDSGLCLMCKGICRLWVPRVRDRIGDYVIDT